MRGDRWQQGGAPAAPSLLPAGSWCPGDIGHENCQEEGRRGKASRLLPVMQSVSGGTHRGEGVLPGFEMEMRRERGGGLQVGITGTNPAKTQLRGKTKSRRSFYKKNPNTSQLWVVMIPR